MLTIYLHVLLEEVTRYAYLIPNAADDINALLSAIASKLLSLFKLFELVLVRPTFRFLTTEGC